MVFMSNVYKAQAVPCSFHCVEPGSDPNLKLSQEAGCWSWMDVFVVSFTLLGTGLFPGQENK